MDSSSSLPMVSVLMTTFNRDFIIGRAIESVLNQTYQDFELLVIDDGSSDHTKGVVDSYRKNNPGKVKYFYKPNGGLASALNFGLYRAKAEYLCFIDSDDQFKPIHIEKNLTQLLDEKLDFVMSKVDLIYQGAEPQVVDYFNPERRIPFSKIEAIKGTMFGKTEVFRELGGFCHQLVDIDLLVRLKKSSYKWGRLDFQTYDYYFGLCEDSLMLEYSK
jgi:glycosyltransferase involved in cell wall biosynthesis